LGKRQLPLETGSSETAVLHVTRLGVPYRRGVVNPSILSPTKASQEREGTRNSKKKKGFLGRFEREEAKIARDRRLSPEY